MGVTCPPGCAPIFIRGMDAATSLPPADRARAGSVPPDACCARDLAISADLAQRIAVLETENRNLREALATRDLIWSAKLTIAAATGCGPDEAHRLLIEQSQHENRKVREIAAEIVAKG